MTHDEYEQRKRRLEEELRAGVELLETAHRHQLRALNLVWAALGGEGVEIPPPVIALSAATAAVSPPAAPALPAPPARTRQGPWQLYDDVVEALAKIPDIFDRNDICRAIGYEPDRGSLHRTLRSLNQDGVIAVDQKGSGKLATDYRKTGRSPTRRGG